MRTACTATLVCVIFASFLATGVLARDLDEIIKDPLDDLDINLASSLGANLTSEINAGNGALATNLDQKVAGPFRASRGQLPVASASAAFTYEYDPKLDLFVRSADTLGPLFAERTQTLGKGKFAVSSAYTHVGYDTLDGDDLGSLSFDFDIGQQLFNRSGQTSTGIGDDQVHLNADLSIRSDTLFFFATYGILDRLDVGIALPIVFVTVKGDYQYSIVDRGDPPSGNGLNQLEFIQDCDIGQCRKDAGARFDQSRVGVGDIFLRAKYRLWEFEYVDTATAFTLTIPTGGSDNFLGFKHVTGTPLLILSKGYRWVTPHFNAGFAIRDSQDVGQAVWALGAELKAFSWLTIVPDFLGFHDVIRAGDARDDVYQSSIGFKANPFGQYVAGFNLQFPLNRDQGLRADVIYSVQIEATF